MSEKPISPLRQRILEDMTVRKFGEATQRNYIRAVKTLSEFLGRSPATATPEDLRRLQVHQSGTGAQPPLMNNTVSALRFFFRVRLDRPEMARHLTLVRQPRKLPNVLNEQEVLRLLEHASGVKYRAALGGAYGAGLRVSEVANLKVSDIDSKRADPGRGGQGQEGPQRHALAAAVAAAARLVAGGAADDMAVPRPRPAAAGHDTPALSRRRGGGRGRRDCDPRVAAHAAPQLCHPPLGAGRRHPRDPGAARNNDKLDTTARYAHVAAKVLREVTSPLDRLTPIGPRRGEPPK